MPFSITTADSECVRVATLWFDGWDVKDLFYMHIYIPLGLFGFIIYRIYYAPRGSRREVRFWERALCALVFFICLTVF